MSSKKASKVSWVGFLAEATLAMRPPAAVGWATSTPPPIKARKQNYQAWATAPKSRERWPL
ncbi:hypothetical protein FAK_12900 [Desulfoferula mesophila]|uniref:Secreted protein n=1 Tax=Desulfoferula mesophila TaxID=3058419 RepID=A0AAU9EI25_9BACT|nr:hypothetical protein FAK_12900 [Desulfoferula mesophilus]